MPLEKAWSLVLQEVERASSQSRDGALNTLNQILRRFRQYRGEAEWTAVLLDGASEFAAECAVFSVTGENFDLRGARGLNLPRDLRLTANAAHALSTAVASSDVVVALKTATEVGEDLAAAAKGPRVCAAPILNQSRVVAVLVAFGAEAAVAAVEAITGMASLVLERQTNVGTAVQIAPALALPPPARERRLPAWADLNEEDRALHVRAQRFARTKVAEIQLANPEAGRAGREQNNVYLFWKSGIDTAREAYRVQFLQNRTMVDYLHLELVHTAAEGDEAKLGADYPGPME